jgi:hypothetical protein
MNNQTFRYEVILDQSICGKQLKKYQECVDQAKNAKSKEKCGKKYKKYQFCLANAESDRLNQQKFWEAFKEKWGHYPNEAK